MSGYTVKPLQCEDAKKLDRAFGITDVFMEFNPGQCLLPPYHTRIAQKVLDFPIREDDIWLLSFPRTGSTWCQEMIWLLGNNLDFESAKSTIQQIRAPLIELSTALAEYQELGPLVENSVEYINNLPSPRFIKSHLPSGLLPTQLDKIKPKIVYIARNPKDVCVSYYKHLKMLHNHTFEFEEWADLFIRGLTPIGPIWPHYLAFWNQRDESNLLFLKYEDMKRDLRNCVKRMAKFLERNYSEEQYDELCEFLSFSKMRENKGCNLEVLMEKRNGKGFFQKYGSHFIRKGEIGDWKNHMSPELTQRFDKWIEENTKNTGLCFD